MKNLNKKPISITAMEVSIVIMVACTAVLIGLGVTALVKKVSISTDEQTEQLCRDYAKGRPWTALNKERIEFLGQEYLENFDYYTSCIINIKNPVKK